MWTTFWVVVGGGDLVRRFLTMMYMAVAVCSAQPAYSQVTPAGGYVPPDDTQSIGVGAVIFYDYTFSKSPRTTDAAGQPVRANAFNVVRTYINVTGRISSIVSFRITPDITRETGSGGTLDGSMSFRLKYGYAQMTLDRFTGTWRNTWVRVGTQQTPFIDAEEPVYRYRFQGTVFAERDGAMSSADSGVSFHTSFPNNYGDVHVGLYNGEGYTRAEANDQKALMLRATVRPLPMGSGLQRGLRFTGYLHRDHVVSGADRHRYMGSVWLEQRKYNAGFDYLTRSDQTLPTAARVKSAGYSFFVTPFFQEKGNGFEALVRFDSFRPNTANASARQNRMIAGIAYWFPHPSGNATAALLLDYERVRFRNFSTPTPTQERIILHGLVNF
jgi:hypothetical protein